MRTIRLVTIFSFGLGLIITIVGLLLKNFASDTGGLILKIGIFFDVVFILSLLFWIVKSLTSEE